VYAENCKRINDGIGPYSHMTKHAYLRFARSPIVNTLAILGVHTYTLTVTDLAGAT